MARRWLKRTKRVYSVPDFTDDEHALRDTFTQMTLTEGDQPPEHPITEEGAPRRKAD